MSLASDWRYTFNQVALDYDAARPSYPDELIEDILTLSAIPENGSIIEVGCGSGQATLPFARRGYHMTCLDIGSDLLVLAARKCQAYAQVRFECAAFEDWQPGEERFDLLLSATAFHWIPPQVGYPKAASLLNDAGTMALFWNFHPKPFTGFAADVQEIYRRIVPEWPDPNCGPSLEQNLHTTQEEINRTGLFETVLVKAYAWTKDYTTAEHLRLLNTHSDHHNLEENTRNHLFHEIGGLIDQVYGGKITRPYLTALFLAHKKKLG